MKVLLALIVFYVPFSIANDLSWIDGKWVIDKNASLKSFRDYKNHPIEKLDRLTETISFEFNQGTLKFRDGPKIHQTVFSISIGPDSSFQLHLDERDAPPLTVFQTERGMCLFIEAIFQVTRDSALDKIVCLKRALEIKQDDA